MAFRKLKTGATLALTVAIAAIAVSGVLRGETPPQGKSFGWVDPDYTQELFATTSSFAKGGNYLGGVAVLPSGDVFAAECVTTGTRLHRFSATLTIQKNGTAIHVETILPSAGGCGIVYHPDGTLYLNMNDGVHGVANVNPTTGALIRYLGTPGNAVGIAVDPVSNHIVYADKNCVSTVKAPNKCSLLDLDTVSGVVTTRATFPITSVAFVNGIYFDPTGAYMFLSNRAPLPPKVTVLTSAGTIVQDLDMGGSDPVGIGFNALSPKFVVTNNTDGSMTRFDFPNDDYTQVPASSNLALFGYRGDLMQAGPDGCLYVTQGGARYNDGTDENGSKSNSLARICGGFAPAAGVPTNDPPVAQGTLFGIVTDALTGTPIAGAKVVVATGTGIAVNSDVDGTYSLKLAPGTYAATGSATNYTSLTTNAIAILNTKSTESNFALMPLPGTLQGVVTDAATGNPVSGAVVALAGGASLGKSDATDASGRYVITGVLPGSYTATISQTYYDTLTTPNVTVPINASATMNFALTQTPGTIQGTITGNAGPIAGATVTLSNGATATADGSGQYVFSSVTPGVYSATAKAATFANATTSNISLPNAGSKTVDFTLTPLPGTLQGTVKNAAGTAIAGVTVTIAGKSAKTSPTGAYSISNITPGTYTVTATMNNYDAFTAAGIVIANAATVSYDITLTQTPGPISGVIRDTAAKPLAGATVTLSNGSTTTTDATGAYSFASVMPGTYTLTASLATYANATANVTLLNASSVQKDLTLTPLPGTLTGIVTNAGGQPIASATVSIAGKSAPTNAAGAYSIVSITPGTYTATISASNYNTQTIPGIVIPNAATVTQNVTLTQTPGTIKGVVVNTANAAVANATVVLSNGGSAITDVAGNYTISGVMPGSYGATVSATNYNTFTTPANSPIVLANAGTATRNFTLSQTAGTLSGTVSALGGTPLVGATVTVSNGASAQTTAGGGYIVSLMPGTYTVTATAVGYSASSPVTVTMLNNGTATQTFTLTPLPGSLKGVVTSGTTPVAGATVVLSNGGGSAVTDAAGNYAIASLTPGTYTATVSATTYNTLTTAGIVIANGATTTQNFTLTPLPGSLQGLVTNSSGTAVPATTVQLSNGSSATTDAGGRYTFSSITPGTYNATATATNYDVASATGIAIPNAGTTTYNFTLTQTPGKLQGTVTGTGGAAIAGATVQIAGGTAVSTDAAGHYLFPSVMPGTYNLTVVASNYDVATASGIVMPNAGSVTRDFALTQTPGTLKGTVSDLSGARIAGALVSLSNGASATADGTGAYTIATLVPGTYTATASAGGYANSAATTVVIVNGSTTTQDFKLSAMPGSIQGVVTDASGAVKIAGATVVLANGSAVVATTTTAASGAYAFAAVAAGSYVATASAPAYLAQSASVSVANGGSTTRNFALVPSAGSLQGVVSAAAAGTPLDGATVALSNGMASVTDATGHYSFPSLTPGTYNATVTAKAANASGCNGPNPYFQLGAASNLTLLGIDVAGCAGTKINMGSNTTLIEGDLAIGNSVSATIQAGSIHGKVIADPGGVYTLTKNGPNVQGGVTRASISAAVSDVTAAAARLAKLTPTQKLAAISSSVTIAGNGGVNVVTIPSLKIVNGQLTLQGSAADIFVFNVAGKFELDNSDIVLSGGVLACNVLWNFTGSAISESNEVELENGSTAAGIFLAMSRLVDLENSMLSGQVLAGGDLEVWGSTILMPAPTAAGVAYDPLTVNGIVIPPGTPVTQNFGLSVTVPLDPCKAANTYFGLGSAASYSLLGLGVSGCSGTTIDMGDKTSSITGDVGVGGSVDATLEGGSIQGKLVVDNSGSYTITRNGTVVQGGVTKVDIDAAVAAATSAAARFARMTPTQKLAAINNTSATIKGNGGVNVISLPSVIMNNDVLTIQGTASDIFVVNVAGKFELDASRIVLSGGVKACNLLWNFTGTTISGSNEVELENGSTGVGIFLALSRLVDLEDSTLNGRVLAGGDLEVWSSVIKPQ